MPDNTTQIPAPRVDLVEPSSGLISRQWFRYFNNLNTIVGGGTGVIGVVNGGTGVSTTPANGELLIGNGTGYTVNTLTEGTGVGVTNGAGSITPYLKDTAVIIGSYGDAAKVGTFTVNQQGQLTAAADVSIAIDASQVTSGTLSTLRGGTGLNTYSTGDILYASAPNTLTKLTKPTVASMLAMTAAGVPYWKAPSYGSFYDTTSQTAAVINTAYPLTFNNTSLSSGISIGTPTSRIVCTTSGIYNFQFSIQLARSSGGTGLAYIWARINGVDQANTAGQIRLSGNGSEIIPAWNFIFNMNAGDYFELVWSTDDLAIYLLASPAVAPVPGIPSVILTVTDNVSAA